MVLQYDTCTVVLHYIIVLLVLSLAPFPTFEFEDFHGAVSIPSPSIFICCATNHDELEGCSSRTVSHHHADWIQRLIPTKAHAQFANSEVIYELKERTIACMLTFNNIHEVAHLCSLLHDKFCLLTIIQGITTATIMSCAYQIS